MNGDGELYAIRKNEYAGVYTEKAICDYIKEIESNCSVRVFDVSEFDKALKWAKVEALDLFSAKLREDKRFNEILMNYNILTNTKEQTIKNIVKSKKSDNSSNTIVERLIIDKDNVKAFCLNTKYNGILLVLNKFFYHEKYWDREYEYNKNDLVRYGYVDYKQPTIIEKKGEGVQLTNCYVLEREHVKFGIYKIKDKSIDIYLNEKAVESVEPINNSILEWLVYKEYVEYKFEENQYEQILLTLSME